MTVNAKVPSGTSISNRLAMSTAPEVICHSEDSGDKAPHGRDSQEENEGEPA